MFPFKTLEYAIWNLLTSLANTTVLIFLLPSLARIKHWYSKGGGGGLAGALEGRGVGLVLPSYLFIVTLIDPLVLDFWNIRVSSLKNASYSKIAILMKITCTGVQALPPTALEEK